MIPTSILKLFGRSPISPLQKHMAEVHECTETLQEFFVAVFEGDWDKAETVQAKIASLEKKADAIKRDIRLNIPKSIFLPVSRSDLLDLLTAQDRVANKAKDIAGIILGRKMQFPLDLQPQIMNFLERSLAASTQANKAISELDELLEAGFRGSEVAIVEEMLDKLDQIETETDSLQISVRRSLYKLEKDLHPVDVMFLYKIIEWIGELADRAQHAGGRLQLLLAR